MGKLKEFADNRGICVLLVHHTSKRKADDSFENINGSTGIMGASDFTIVLDKKNRMDDEASFVLTGRDIEQQDRVVAFDKARCKWTMWMWTRARSSFSSRTLRRILSLLRLR